jgi:hypothetical protein
MSKNMPVHEVKFGRVRATVWANEGESGVWHSVQFSRLYRDKEGKWQDADGFGREDLPLLIKAADQVHTFLYQAVGREAPEEPRGREPM